MAHVRFRRRKWVHTRLCSKDRTQWLTRRNRGRFGWGWYHYSRSVPHVHQHPRAGYQNDKFCRFWGLVVGAPEGVAAPLGCVIFSVSVEIAACTPCSRYFFRFSRRSSLCYSCASCVSARSLSARSCSRVFGFVIVLDLLF